MNINNHLRKYGYRPDLSNKVLDKYETALSKYLGEERYLEFSNLRDYVPSEYEILNFIGNDLRFLKLVISGQLTISIEILKTTNKIIKDLDIDPENILELGGTDGWAIDYLQKENHWNANMYNIDKNPIWEVRNKKINLVNDSYKNFHSDTKFDLIFSILGAPFDDLQELFQCVAHNLSKNGTAILGLRIATDKQFMQSLKLADSLNLKTVLGLSSKVESLNEEFPILVIQRSNVKLTDLDILSLIRNAFHLLEPVKRINGVEAEYFLPFISDGEQLSTSKKEWENGDFIEIEMINKNNINYRKTTNNQEDLIIEYPIELDDPCNNAEIQLNRMHQENIFNNNK